MSIVTRLAPSPTGHLHLGNAWSFLLCWLAARSRGGHVILRIDDIDPQRSKPEFARAIIEDLRWLGLDWDGEPVWQSANLELYKDALARLDELGRVFPCFCARKDLKLLASAPHGEEPVYPGFCRDLTPEEIAAKGDKPAALRFRAEEDAVFTDLLLGEQIFTPARFGGDFPLRRSDGVYSYQLATSADDAASGVTLVARGRDLLASAGRQVAILNALNIAPPVYAHLPLILDETGERLAKRHHGLALSSLRAAGVKAEAIVGRLAFLANLNPENRPLAPRDLLASFSFDALPREDIKINTDVFAWPAR